MAIEEFKHCPRINASAEIKFRTRKAEFGDGYTQVAGDGLNVRGQEWALEFVGEEKTIQEIADFLDRHSGFKSFLWKPPLNKQGLWRCDSYKPTALGGGVYSLSASFVQAFAP